MKILYITSRFPYPIDKGDKLRAYHQLKLLSQTHEIFLITISTQRVDSESVSEIKKFVPNIQIYHIGKIRMIINLIIGFFKEIPFQTSMYYSRSIHKLVLNRVINFDPEIIFYQLIRTTEYSLPIEYKNVVSVVDYIDALSKGLYLRISQSNVIIRFILGVELRRVEKYEIAINKKMDDSIIITENDKKVLFPNDNKNISIIPNGIDSSYFTKKDLMKDIDILFVGNLSYPPNIKAIEFFMNNIWDELIKTSGDIKLCLAGASPSLYIRNLSSSNIIVTGWVDDIREYYSRAKIFIAPMQSGTGLQNKILEAMSMELPAIISRLAQNGINAEHGRNLFVIDESKEIIKKINELLINENIRNKIGKNAREFVKENYNWSQIGNLLENFLKNKF